MRLSYLGDSTLLSAKDESITATIPAKNPVRLDGTPPGITPGGLILLTVALGLTWSIVSALPPPQGATLRG